MGQTVIAAKELALAEYDQNGNIRSGDGNKPVLYRGYGGIVVAWFQPLRLTGNYRMEVRLSTWDVIRLFKSCFGSEITQHMVKDYGLTFSPEVVKSMLKTVKLADLTLADLFAIQAEQEREQAAAKEAARAEDAA